MIRLFRTILIPLVLLPSLLCAADRLPDGQITRSLQEALRRDFRLKDAEIRVTTQSGSVTLRGTVTSYVDKHTAEQMANRTVGVHAVVNMIRVESAFRRDDEIASDVLRRLSQSSSIRPSQVKVQVAGGVVTLTGQVPTWAQRRQAQVVAGEVRGVRRVSNNLTLGGPEVSATSNRTDEQIKVDVQAGFDRDVYLAGLPIQVSVGTGVVRLQGEVPNLFHKEHAGDQACLIANVRIVENRLIVTSQMMLESLPEPPNDEDLERLVLRELQVDPRIAAGDVEVMSSRRKLTLRGTVASMYEKQAAERLARRVIGVAGVENLLEVLPSARSDDEMRDDVQFNLNSDSLLAGQNIVVVVKDAVVTLSGEVNDYTSRQHAARLTTRVRGVRAITNELKVRWSESTNDEIVRQQIVQRFSSNTITRPVAGRIQVVVKEGVVTLTGNAERSSEVIEAERIAKTTDGVRAVENQLLLLSPAAADDDAKAKRPDG